MAIVTRIIRLLERIALKNKIIAGFCFIALGIISTCWFLFRVIPKPSRVYYPCMQATAPFMTSLVIYLLGLSATTFSFRRYRHYLNSGKGILALSFLSLAFMSVFFMTAFDKLSAFASVKNQNTTLEAPNSPMGIGKGIFPGRVVWDYNPNAVNQNLKGDWTSDLNTWQYSVDNMVTEIILKLTGKETEEDAWDALFKWFNKQKGRGERGYQDGEKIMIKANTTFLGQVMTTSPQLMYSLLTQLVYYANVPEEMIYIGDPNAGSVSCYEKLHEAFPSVNYVGWGGDYQLEEGNSALGFSDNRTIVKTNEFPKIAKLWTCYTEADYLINLPALKAHVGQGITVGAKNHFGSHCNGSAMPLHNATDVSAESGTPGYHQYRAFVDIMGNKYLGGNTMLTMVDGLWSGRDWDGTPEKWEMSPFEGKYPSSIFASQDQVAIESVCYDFLRNQFDAAKIDYVDDYMHQAADPANWPAGISYRIKSLGTHEHWNDPVHKQYSQNLGINNGIHLVSIPSDLVIGSDNILAANEYNQGVQSIGLSPNPALNFTDVSFDVSSVQKVELSVFDLSGRSVLNTTIEKTVPGLNHKTINLEKFRHGEFIITLSSNKQKIGSSKLIVL